MHILLFYVCFSVYSYSGNYLMRIYSSSFQACIARDGVGGAIALISIEGVDMQDVSIVSCSAVDGGGVFFGTDIRSNLVRVNFTSNSATVNGGALWIGQINKINMIITTGIKNLLNEKYASMILINAQGFNGNKPRYYYPGLPRNYFISLNLKV